MFIGFFSPPTCFWESGTENHQKDKDFFIPAEPLKSMGKKGKKLKKTRDSWQGKKEIQKNKEGQRSTICPETITEIIRFFESLLDHFGVGLPEPLLSHSGVTLILFCGSVELGGCPLHNGSAYPILSQEQGIFLQKHRDRNGGCVTRLFKSIWVRG